MIYNLLLYVYIVVCNIMYNEIQQIIYKIIEYIYTNKFYIVYIYIILGLLTD